MFVEIDFVASNALCFRDGFVCAVSILYLLDGTFQVSVNPFALRCSVAEASVGITCRY